MHKAAIRKYIVGQEAAGASTGSPAMRKYTFGQAAAEPASKQPPAIAAKTMLNRETKLGLIPWAINFAAKYCTHRDCRVLMALRANMLPPFWLLCQSLINQLY